MEETVLLGSLLLVGAIAQSGADRTPIDIESVLGGIHWIGASEEQLPGLREAFLSLATIDPKVLLPRVEEYVKYRRDADGSLLVIDSAREVFRRQVDVAVLALAMLIPEIPIGNAGLTGLRDVFDLHPWTFRQGERVLLQCPSEKIDMVVDLADGVELYGIVADVAERVWEGTMNPYIYFGGFQKSLRPKDWKSTVPPRIDIFSGVIERYGQSFSYGGSSGFSDVFLKRSLRRRLEPNALHIEQYAIVVDGAVLVEEFPPVGYYVLPPSDWKAMVLVRDYAQKVPFTDSAMADHVSVDYRDVGFLYNVRSRDAVSEREWTLISRSEQLAKLSEEGVELTKESIWKVFDLKDRSALLTATSVYLKYEDDTNAENVHTRVALFQIFVGGEVVFCGTADQRSDFNGNRAAPKAKIVFRGATSSASRLALRLY